MHMPGCSFGGVFGTLSRPVSRSLGFLSYIVPAFFVLVIYARPPSALPLKAEVRRKRDAEPVWIVLNKWALEVEPGMSWLTLQLGSEAMLSETAFPCPRSFSLLLLVA